MATFFLLNIHYESCPRLPYRFIGHFFPISSIPFFLSERSRSESLLSLFLPWFFAAVNCQITRLIFPRSHSLRLPLASRETICQAQDGCCVRRRGIIFLGRYWIFSSVGQAQNGRTDCTLNIVYIYILRIYTYIYYTNCTEIELS